MSNEWVDSVERAIEIAEGQLALARALELKIVGIQADDLEKILNELKSLKANYECREYLEGR